MAATTFWRVYDRDDVPNPNPPVGSVGPQSRPGEVMDFTPLPTVQTSAPVPPGAQAWDGWPNGWTAPWSMGGPWSGLQQRSTTLWMVLDLNTSLLSTMPAYTTTKGVPNDPEPSWIVNPQPEVYASFVEWLRELLWMWWLGEAIVWATSRFANGYPRTFINLPSSDVDIRLRGVERRYFLRGVDITADVLHLRYMTWPGYAHGIGPLEVATYPMATETAVEQFTANLAARGGLPWAVLQHPASLTAAQSESLRSNYVTARLNARTLGEDASPLILSGGLTLQPLTISVKDLALLDIAGMAKSEIAYLFSCPAYLVGLPTGESSLTYNNAEDFRVQHWRAYLRPKAAQVMAGLSNWLLPRGTQLELNRDEYTKPELLERVQAYQMMFNMQDPVTGERMLGIQEARDMERLGPATPEELPEPTAAADITTVNAGGAP